MIASHVGWYPRCLLQCASLLNQHRKNTLVSARAVEKLLYTRYWRGKQKGSMFKLHIYSSVNSSWISSSLSSNCTCETLNRVYSTQHLANPIPRSKICAVLIFPSQRRRPAR